MWKTNYQKSEREKHKIHSSNANCTKRPTTQSVCYWRIHHILQQKSMMRDGKYIRAGIVCTAVFLQTRCTWHAHSRIDVGLLSFKTSTRTHSYFKHFTTARLTQSGFGNSLPNLLQLLASFSGNRQFTGISRSAKRDEFQWQPILHPPVQNRVLEDKWPLVSGSLIVNWVKVLHLTQHNEVISETFFPVNLLDWYWEN